MTPHSTEAVRDELVTPWVSVAPHAERLAAYRVLLAGVRPHPPTQASVHAAEGHPRQSWSWDSWLTWVRRLRLTEHGA